MRQRHRIKFISMITCFCFMMVLACSFIYEIKEAGHDCLGTDCHVCAQIETQRSIGKHLTSGILTAIGGTVLLYLGMTRLKNVPHPFMSPTPVKLKVKMNC